MPADSTASPTSPENPATTSGNSSYDDLPRYRYDAKLACDIEARWQSRWANERTFETPNPSGALSQGFDAVKDRPKLFVMDMFPYPSGSGLHVGHPLGYIGTDMFARFGRMSGYNVLHTMGYDAFGLPAEQYAVQTGQHPRVTTEQNVDNMRRQLGRLGLGHDPRRSIATTDENYYRWTQWIFLQIFNSWYDADKNKARPIAELVDDFNNGRRTLTRSDGRSWADLSDIERQKELEAYRLAYIAEAPVNWCPALGTVLANEEVTNDGRSERGNYPVFRRPMRQWMMRITSYAERLIDDLDLLQWPEPIKLMQRNWIGRSTGAEVDFEVAGSGAEPLTIKVFTTRPDTLFGATYMVLAPEHELIDKITTAHWPQGTNTKWKGALDSETPVAAVAEYQGVARRKTDLERQIEDREKTGVFTGSFAINPVNGDKIPVFIADYVLTGYGTGAIMAVPAHDERDFAFAKLFDLPITAVITPSETWCDEHKLDQQAPAETWPEAYTGDGAAIHSHNTEVSLDGLTVAEAKEAICKWLSSRNAGKSTITYKLRDWLFSRQRYWGEPFPIVWDENDVAYALPETALPVTLPEVEDYAPVTSDQNDEALPDPPLGRAVDWKTVTLDLGNGAGEKTYRRELNTMPQWAGSCWYYLRYIDPLNENNVVDPVNEKYWMGVDLYVGGVEHAVLHLLYARFWHKVLFDLQHVSGPEPFNRLFNQGMVQADAFTDSRGIYVNAFEVVEQNGEYFHSGERVERHLGKMGKSLKNSVNPDDVYNDYGADSLRLYEMSMGPLDADRPWTTTGIVGLYRFLQRLWRNVIDEDTGETKVTDTEPDRETRHILHTTIAGVRDDMTALRFNTAIAKLIELNNHLTKAGSVDRSTAEAMVLMLAPLAPHVAEEIWAKLGHATSLAHEPFPVADEKELVATEIEVPVQVQGKVRAKLTVAPGQGDEALKAAALAEPNVAKHLEGKTIRKVIVITDRMVNIVAG